MGVDTLNERYASREPEHMKLAVEAGGLLFDIDLDVGFFSSTAYEWGQEFSHNHAAYEIHLVQKGRCIMYVDDTYAELEAGSYCVIPPGTYHSQLSVMQGAVVKICFRFSYRATSGGKPHSAGGETNVLLRVLDAMTFYTQKDDGRLSLLVSAVQDELQAQPLGYLAKVRSLFAQMMIDIIRFAPSASSAAYGFPEQTPDDLRTNVIDAFFASHYNGDIREEDLARQLNVSTRQLNRILNERYRASFRQKLLQTRMKVAMDLLKNTDMPVSHIAERVGYQTAGSFYTAFKTNVGITPLAFRQG
ncbi:AraC family transcriptional regulator [Paenibacillus contaminans]|nr:helix-turn-helix domain-containing protein [Paenibacillus contaminans]